MDRAAVLEKHGYAEYSTAEGRVYFYNSGTGESIWELPQNIMDELNNDKEEIIPITDVTKYLAPEIPFDRDNEDLFISMLKDNQVDATWSFNEVIEKLIGDKRYWSVKDPLLKQKVFENYLINRSRDELLKENNSIEKFEEAFIKILQKNEVNYCSRWITIKKRISNESIYKHSIISEKIKRQVFEKYVNKLKTEKEESEKSLKEKAILELNDYLNSLKFITLETKWDEFLNFIKNDKRFEQNKHFKVLNQLDLLKTFEDIIKKIQLVKLESIKELKAKNYTQDRIRRDSFNRTLNELRSQGKIRANTQWTDIYPLIKSDSTFIELLGRTNSSNPFELFQYIIKEEDNLIIAKRAIVEQLLIHNNIKIDLNQDLNDQLNKIKDFLKGSQETANIDEITVDLIYEKILVELKQQLIKNKEKFKYSLTRNSKINKSSKFDELNLNFNDFNINENDALEIFHDYLKILEAKEHEKSLELNKIIQETNSRKRNIQQIIEPQEELDY